MTKGELRRARKQARAQGKPLADELILAPSDRDDTQPEFTESSRGHKALDRWARFNDESEGRYDY